MTSHFRKQSQSLTTRYLSFLQTRIIPFARNVLSDIAQMRQDIEVLKSADSMGLNEVDWGLKRTGYRAVVRELGDALKFD